MNELALFAGAGGGILGGKLLGWNTVCGVEFNAYAASVLVSRQNDRHLPPFPIWDDVRTFDGRPWAGIVDVVSGGFPCQDISIAGKGAGIAGKRSGLWGEMARIVSEVRPRFVFVENSPLLIQRGLAVVLTDLAKMGFDARWGIVSAESAGAPHKRERFWLVGFNTNEVDAARNVRPGSAISETEVNGHGDTECKDGKKTVKAWNRGICELGAEHGSTGASSYSDALRILDGMADRVDRLAALGNGQVPAVAAIAWHELTKGLKV